MIDQLVEHNVQRMNIQDDIYEKDIWKYESSFDYHYGKTMGMILRMLREEFEKMYQRRATEQEIVEISQITSQNAFKIRHSLAYLKDRPSET